MRQIRTVLRLHLDGALSYREIARALGLSRGAIGNLVSFARAAGVDWAVAQTLTDAELEARLHRAKGSRSSGQLCGRHKRAAVWCLAHKASSAREER